MDTLAVRAFAAIVSSVPVTTRWVGNVPRSTIAAGVAAGFPPRISFRVIASRFAIPMRTTTVSAPAACSTVSAPPGRGVPVANATEDAARRSVTGMPA